MRFWCAVLLLSALAAQTPAPQAPAKPAAPAPTTPLPPAPAPPPAPDQAAPAPDPAAPAAPAASPAPAAAASNDNLPPGPGKDLVASTCDQCHDLSMVTTSHLTPADWQNTVDAMNDKGAGLSDADVATVVAYLAKNFGVKQP